jgi:GT2 family glycosyltransferase
MEFDDYEVLVVDNASTDDSREILNRQFPQVRVVTSSKNLGTAEGSNIGAKHSKGKYILWLSNDMEVDPQLLSRMIERIDSSPDIAICTCKMRRLDASNRRTHVLDSVGAELDIFGFPSARGVSQFDRGQFDNPSDVFFSFGGAMLIRREIINRIGGFDAEFFTLADDIDLSWRAHLAGYRIIVEPRALLYHRVSATLGRFGRERKRYLVERNTLRMLMKNYGGRTLLRNLPGYFGLFSAENAFFLVNGRVRIVINEVKAVLWNLKNLKDTLRKRYQVQSLRIASDDQIQKKMKPLPGKVTIFKEYLSRQKDSPWDVYFG